MKIWRRGDGWTAGFLAVAMLLLTDTALSASTISPSSAETGVAVSASPFTQLADLLSEFEENVRSSAQNVHWQRDSARWSVELLFDREPTPAQLTTALQELELSFKSSALASDWDARRVAWYASLRRATLPAQIADLMKQLELAVKPEAMEDAWKVRRSAWFEDISAAWRNGSASINGAGGSPSSLVASPAPAQARTTDTSAIARLAGLITDFESNVKPDSMIGPWATERTTWADALSFAETVADLKAALQEFEVSIRRAATLENWNSERTAWYASLRAATTPAHVAPLLRQLEGSFKRDAMGTFWVFGAGFWRTHVDEVAAGAAINPVTPETSSASAANRPVAVGAIQSLAQLLFELERNMDPASMHSQWPTNRVSWADALHRATSVDAMKAAMQEFEASVNAEARPVSWITNMNTWYAAVRAANTPSQIAQQLEALERSIRWQAMKPGWDSYQDAWYGKINVAVAVTSPAAATLTPTAATRPAASSPSSAAPIPAPLTGLASRIIELENSIASSAQQANWGTLRDAWIARVTRATTLSALGTQLLELEATMQPGSMVSRWSGRRSAWINEVRSTNDLDRMKDLTDEFDSAIGIASRLDDEDWD